MKLQHSMSRGGFGLGIVVGLLVGLALALAVALYITRAPIPFVNKVPPRTAEQDTAEAERNRNWDPNAPLGSKVPLRPVPGVADGGAAGAASAAIAGSGPATGLSMPPPLATLPPARDPAAILSGTAPAAAPAAAPARPAGDPFIYFVQAGAFSRTEDAEQQRARLAIAGHQARISEREQAGRTVYRVRLGPLSSRDAADGLQSRLKESGVDAQIVRVEKP